MKNSFSKKPFQTILLLQKTDGSVKSYSRLSLLLFLIVYSSVADAQTKPSLISFSPKKAYAGQYMEIIGQNLSAAGLTPVVTIGGIQAYISGINFNYSNIQIRIPDGASGYIKVSHAGGTDSLGGFTFIGPPTILGFSPLTAQPTDTVIIKGLNLVDISNVYFGDSSAAYFKLVGDTIIKTVVGHGSTGSISVEQAGRFYRKEGFTFNPLPPPTIESFTPNNVISGTEITIRGQNLWGIKEIKVGTVKATRFKQETKETLKIIAPVNGAGLITLSTYYGTYTLGTPQFIRLLPPIIKSFSPEQASPGEIVSINGSGFGTNVNGVKVYFGASLATVEKVQDNMILAKVPSSSSFAPIEVTVRNLTAASTSKFLAVNPAISRLRLSTETFLDAKQPVQGSGRDMQCISFDMNLDGKPDFATLDFHGSTVFQLNKSTPGNVSWKKGGSTPESPVNIDAADMDGDGKKDIIMFSVHGAPMVALNASTKDSLIFRSPESIYVNYGLAADLNCDGKKDIITMVDEERLRVFYNNSIPGKLIFSDTLEISSSFFEKPWQLSAITDINSDELPDLIGIKGNSVVIFINTGTKQIPAYEEGPLQLAITDIPSASNIFPRTLQLTDLNKDGLPDLLITHTSSGSFCIYKNSSKNGQLSFGKYQLYNNISIGYYGLQTGDFNGDGFPDLLASDGIWLYVYENRSFQDSIILSDQISKRTVNGAVCIVDIDGDGKQDIVGSTTNDLFVLKNRLDEPLLKKVCPGEDVRLQASFQGLFYRWQIDSGDGFKDLIDDSLFTGTDTRFLDIPNIRSRFNQYQFRCITYLSSRETVMGEPYLLEMNNTWLGNSATLSWHDASNWSCGKIPDEYTNVVIPNFKWVEVSSNAACRTLILEPFSKVTIKAPYQLTITHQ